MESPALVAALHAADLYIEATNDVTAALAKAMPRLDDYGPLLARQDVAEANWQAANLRLTPGLADPERPEADA